MCVYIYIYIYIYFLYIPNCTYVTCILVQILLCNRMFVRTKAWWFCLLGLFLETNSPLQSIQVTSTQTI